MFSLENRQTPVIRSEAMRTFANRCRGLECKHLLFISFIVSSVTFPDDDKHVQGSPEAPLPPTPRPRLPQHTPTFGRVPPAPPLTDWRVAPRLCADEDGWLGWRRGRGWGRGRAIAADGVGSSNKSELLVFITVGARCS